MSISARPDAPARPRRRRPVAAARVRLSRRLVAKRALTLLAATALVLWLGPTTPGPADEGLPAPPTVEVAVADRDLSAGDELDQASFTVHPVDTDLGLTGTGLDPAGRVVRREIRAGEIIVERDLAGTGRDGLLPGERAVAIARSNSPLPVVPGDQVELVAIGVGTDGSVHADVLGRPVPVLSLDDEVVVVAVPETMAPDVVRQQAVGTVELILAP